MKLKNHKKYILLSFGCILLFLNSCVSTKNIYIEIPVQAKKELPAEIQSLTLVNRTVDNRYSDIKSDSLQKLFYLQKFNYDTVIYDLSAVDTTLKALGDLLFESGRYDIVIPEDRNLPFKRNAFLTSEMEPAEVQQLCTDFNTDAVLSIDHFKTRVSTKFTRHRLVSAIFSDEYVPNVEAQMAVIYEALFRVYDPVKERVISREFLRDTLYWSDYGPTTRELMQNFTPVKQALSEAGIAAALDYSDKIGVIWRNESRNYFPRGDANLKKAALFVQSGEWQTAIALWTDTAEKSKSKALKSKAYFNLAVAHELQGNIDKAIDFALKSYKSMYRLITYEYLELLKKRKKELQKQAP